MTLADPASLQLQLRLSEQPQSLPCADCIAFPTCGGHELPLMRAFGCIRKMSDGRGVDPDDMNPLHEDRFWELWKDVDGLLDFRVGPLMGANPKGGFESYIPVLQHEGRRSRPPESDVVTIPLFHILRHRADGSYGPRFPDGSALRRRFRLRDSTKIVLRGVDDDRKLERFWKFHRAHNVGAGLAKLDLLGVTVPNFSFFTDATRFQILRNRKRIVLTCERLSSAGVPVIPHLNALTPADWRFWADFLREHPEITVVCKEFQTGLKGLDEGFRAYLEIVDLQQAIGRKLHPILVAGGRFYQRAQIDFPGHFSVIDSTAFMGAQFRQVLADKGDRLRWVKKPTERGAPVDDHFDQNVRGRKLNLEFGPAPARILPPVPDVEGQMLWADMIGSPYLTDHPLAPGISTTHSGANCSLQESSVIH
jgi:hypothetical protein